MQISKLIITLGIAATLLAAIVGSASARQLRFSETRLTATFPRVEISGSFATVRCNLTLSRSLHSGTFSKVLEALIGTVTEASIGGCEAGSATILRETLPWHVRYAGFVGQLPNFEAIITHVIGVAFRIREPFGIECLFTSSASSPIVGTYNREAGGRISTATTGGTLPSTCGRNGTFSGTSNSITPAVTVTLI